MGWLKRWFARHPAALDYLEGAGMVFYVEPSYRPEPTQPSEDVVALISDMAAVGSDMRRAMKRLDDYGAIRR